MSIFTEQVEDQQLHKVWIAGPEERKEACEAAKNAFKINNFLYRPYRYQPEVMQYDFLNPILKPKKYSRDLWDPLDSDDEEDEEEEIIQSTSFGKMAMYCGTLPSVYVQISIHQPENSPLKYLKAILIHSSFDPFQIRKQNEKPRTAVLGKFNFLLPNLLKYF